MTTTNQLALRLGEDVDILELFFEALSTPKNSIVTELLSGNGQFGQENLTENPNAGIIR